LQKNSENFVLKSLIREMKLPVLVGDLYQINAASLFISFILNNKRAGSSIFAGYLKNVKKQILNGRDFYV